MTNYLFRDGVQLDLGDSDAIITTPYATRSNPNRQKVHIKCAESSVKYLLNKLSQTGINGNPLIKKPNKKDSKMKHSCWEQTLEKLYKRGLIICTIEGCNGIALRTLPKKPGLKLHPFPGLNHEVKLSRFANIHIYEKGFEITSPLSAARLQIQDDRLYGLIPKLATPCPIEQFRAFLPEDLQIHYQDLISLLLNSGIAGISNTNQNIEIDLEPIKAGWSRQDLTFHHNTRCNSVDLDNEDSWTKPVTRQGPPAKHQRIILSRLTLPKPSIHLHNTNFYQIIQKRQTIRAYQTRPINIEALGNLLWYSMHTREEILCDPGLPRAYEGLLRPVASAGALHSIEFYLCIKQCTGISPGFYHYDSFEHSLGRISDFNEACENMLALAVNTTCRPPQADSVSPSRGQHPDVLIVMAARYERQASLHFNTGLAYALILKDAGSIYQQLYLVATALELAPCGLSFGSSELLEQASGISGTVECSVGEFMIGNPNSTFNP